MVEITLPIILQIVQTVGILVGIAYYLIIMRNSQRNQGLVLRAQEQAVETRQAQLGMQLLNRWSTPDLLKSRVFYQNNDFSSFEEYRELWQNPETEMLLRLWGCYCEGIGVLVRENYLDIKIVAGLMGGVVKSDWEKIREHTYRIREITKFPRSWIEWEYLYNALMRYAEENPERSIQDVDLSGSFKGEIIGTLK